MTVRIDDDFRPNPHHATGRADVVRARKARTLRPLDPWVTDHDPEEPYEPPERTGAVTTRPDPGAGIVTTGDGLLSRMVGPLADDQGAQRLERMHRATGGYRPRGRGVVRAPEPEAPATLADLARHLGVDPVEAGLA